jgi:hypothetical protein
MKLRLDLLKYLTAEDIAEAAAESIDRFKPEPLFAKTGKGYLRPATPEEKVKEMENSERRIKRMLARKAAAEKAARATRARKR